jgi:hypothetical protein
MDTGSNDSQGRKRMNRDRIDLALTKAEALVLFEWLSNLDASTSAPRKDSPEQKVLWRVEALLERVLPEPLDPKYFELLQQARRTVLST